MTSCNESLFCPPCYLVQCCPLCDACVSQRNRVFYIAGAFSSILPALLLLLQILLLLLSLCASLIFSWLSLAAVFYCTKFYCQAFYCSVFYCHVFHCRVFLPCVFCRVFFAECFFCHVLYFRVFLLFFVAVCSIAMRLIAVCFIAM